MANKGSILIPLTLLFLLVSGCASFQKISQKLAELQQEKYAREYLQKGRSYENKGDLVGALKQFKLAMTVSPSNQEAIKNRNRIEKALRSSAQAHYQKGLKYHKKGKYGRARKQFLTALRLWPDYPEAAKALTTWKRLETKRYIVHEIRPGENLAKLAKHYYGDYQKFSIIARYNYITDANKVKVGKKIKVPEIEGIELLVGANDIKTEEQVISYPRLSDREAFLTEIENGESETEIQTVKEKPAGYQIAFYRDLGRELFRKKRYHEALDEFKKVLNIFPEDEVALDYCYRSHFQIAQDLLDRTVYLSARDHFRESLRYNEDCEGCLRNIKKSENLYKEDHYKKGMQYYGNEQLRNALREWELVMTMDPNYKKVDYLINKAKMILKKLEEIRATEEKK